MKATVQNITTTIVALALSTIQMFANTTDVNMVVLTDADWKVIEETATLDAMLNMEDLPTSYITHSRVLTTKEWKAIKQQVELETMLEIENNNETLVNELSEAEWKNIADEAELDAMLDFENQ